ncbi:MAG TPA: hypothetical protein VFO24_09905 [Usitatibacter sp.]|nr:hypothetical protein [Usitatibacter sp.]
MPRPRPATRAKARAGTPSVASLRREITRLTKALRVDREAAARRIAALQRAGDRRLAAMMAEIAGLRHHEARAGALERLVAERDAMLAEKVARIADLEARLLQSPTDLG